MNQAPAPVRASFSTVLSFGLLNIQTKVYSGTEETRVPRSEFTADGHPVGRQPYDKVTGAVVSHDDVVRKATSTSGRLVDLSDAEIDACTVSLPGLAKIETLVPLDALGTWLITDKLYQVRATGKGKAATQAAEHALGLILDGLQRRGEAALVRLALRGGSGARIGVLTPAGDLHVCHYADGVRAPLDLPTTEYSEAERSTVDGLLGVIGTSLPDLSDERAEAVQRFVDAKAAGQAPLPSADTTQVTTTDLMAAMQASIDAALAAKGVK